MNQNTSFLFDTPEKLLELQNKISILRKEEKLEIQNGDLGYASAPSNIALIKYWGKADDRRQIPLNSSLSYTLGSFRSSTKVTALGRFFPNDTNHIAKYKNVFISSPQDNKINSQNPPHINAKMDFWIRSILSPFAAEISLQIESHNNFPSACGIASSASGYAALTGAIADLLQLEKYFTPEELKYWLVEWARLGSGSATRSAFISDDESFIKWEMTEDLNTGFSNTVKVTNAPQWKELRHCVFVLDDSEKKISSSEGHTFAKSSPLSSIRIAGIPARMRKMEQALLEFDFNVVRALAEEDAFAMHAVMQTSTPNICYFNGKVARAIEIFVQLRDAKNIRAFWTLDAGPNIHILYMPEAENFIENYHLILQKEWRDIVTPDRASPQFRSDEEKLARADGMYTKVHEAAERSFDEVSAKLRTRPIYIIKNTSHKGLILGNTES